MKKILLWGLGCFVALAIGLFVFANTQFGRVVIGVYQINAGLSAPAPKIPPVGLWHAVYTADFATAHNLPPENITNNLSEGVDYMEMETLPRTIRGPYTMCIVNMLVKKPHDISMWGREEHDRLSSHIPEDRKLLHMIDIQNHKNSLKALGALSASSNDYEYEKSGFMQTSTGVYAEDIIDGYDYFSVNYHCNQVALHPKYFPDGYAFHARQASVWGRYDKLYKDPSDFPNLETRKSIQDSYLVLTIPEEIILNIFESP